MESEHKKKKKSCWLNRSAYVARMRYVSILSMKELKLTLKTTCLCMGPNFQYKLPKLM